MSQAQAVDIGRTLDDGPWSAFQKFGVLLAALAIVLDGFDGQLIGFAIPVLIKEWGVSREDFSPIVAAGLVGMAIGSIVAGPLGDRFGRRRAVIGSVFAFGLATCLIGFSPNLAVLGLLRFVAGLGIGGCLPSATTLAAEFAPARRRTLAVTATIVCVPLGGMLAGFFAGHVLPTLGWRALFWIGGALPVVFAFLLVAALPESPRFLAHRPERWEELRGLLRRMGHAVAGDAAFTDLQEQGGRRASFSALFQDGRGLNTAMLWVIFFLTLLAVYTTFSWLPTMLTTEGLDIAAASSGLTAYNSGGIFGALLCALAINRVGSRWPLVICAAGGAISAFVLGGADGSTSALIVGLAIHGFFVNAVQSTLYAVSAYTYPTIMRATGTAAVLGFGRLGAILSAFVGAIVITAGGGAGYFGLLGASLAAAAVMLLFLRRHIPAHR